MVLSTGLLDRGEGEKRLSCVTSSSLASEIEEERGAESCLNSTLCRYGFVVLVSLKVFGILFLIFVLGVSNLWWEECVCKACTSTIGLIPVSVSWGLIALLIVSLMGVWFFFSLGKQTKSLVSIGDDWTSLDERREYESAGSSKEDSVHSAEGDRYGYDDQNLEMCTNQDLINKPLLAVEVDLDLPKSERKDYLSLVVSCWTWSQRSETLLAGIAEHEGKRLTNLITNCKKGMSIWEQEKGPCYRKIEWVGNMIPTDCHMLMIKTESGKVWYTTLRPPSQEDDSWEALLLDGGKYKQKARAQCWVRDCFIKAKLWDEDKQELIEADKLGFFLLVQYLYGLGVASSKSTSIM